MCAIRRSKILGFFVDALVLLVNIIKKVKRLFSCYYILHCFCLSLHEDITFLFFFCWAQKNFKNTNECLKALISRGLEEFNLICFTIFVSY